MIFRESDRKYIMDMSRGLDLCLPVDWYIRPEYSTLDKAMEAMAKQKNDMDAYGKELDKLNKEVIRKANDKIGKAYRRHEVALDEFRTYEESVLGYDPAIDDIGLMKVKVFQRQWKILEDGIEMSRIWRDVKMYDEAPKQYAVARG